MGSTASCAGDELAKRPKIDVQSFDLMRKYVETGLALTDMKEPLRAAPTSAPARFTTTTTAPSAT